jgi:hypothetical protein
MCILDVYTRDKQDNVAENVYIGPKYDTFFYSILNQELGLQVWNNAYLHRNWSLWRNHIPGSVY